MSLGLIRSLLITDPLIILATIILGSINLVASLFETDGRRQIAIAQFWSRLIIRIAGVRLTITGLEHIDPQGSYVFASNHLSYMDTPVVLGHIPVQFRFLAKKGLFKIPFLGYHLQRAGHIAVPREDPRAAIKTMSLAAETIQQRGISILIFPEGGRTRDGRMHEFKDGASYIAIKAGVPVVPIGLIGTRAVLPMGSLNIRPGAVEMHVGQPIPTSGLSLKDRGALTEQTRQEVAKLIGQIEADPAASAPAAGSSTSV